MTHFAAFIMFPRSYYPMNKHAKNSNCNYSEILFSYLMLVMKKAFLMHWSITGTVYIKKQMCQKQSHTLLEKHVPTY